MRSRRTFLVSLCTSLVCGRAVIVPSAPAGPTDTTDAAIARGRQYLQSAQARDGAWRSDKYSSFRDGPSLTPLVLLALDVGRTSIETNAAFTRGTDYLVGLVRPDGTIDAGQFGLSYPVYSAALAVRLLSLPGMERHRAARATWLSDLRRRQLDESLGWSQDDAAYGGSGYCHSIPRKPKSG